MLAQAEYRAGQAELRAKEAQQKAQQADARALAARPSPIPSLANKPPIPIIHPALWATL